MTIHCSFCNKKNKTDDDHFVADDSERVFICESCITQCVAAVSIARKQRPKLEAA